MGIRTMGGNFISQFSERLPQFSLENHLVPALHGSLGLKHVKVYQLIVTCCNTA